MPGSINAALGADGAPITLEWRGKVRTLQKLEISKVVGALERWLIEREAASLADNLGHLVDAGRMGVDQLADRIAAFTDDAVNNGRYSYGSPRMMRIFKAIESGKTTAKDGDGKDGAEDGNVYWGMLKLLSLLFGMSVDEAVELMADKKVEALAKLRQVITEGQPDPKGSSAP